MVDQPNIFDQWRYRALWSRTADARIAALEEIVAEKDSKWLSHILKMISEDEDGRVRAKAILAYCTIGSRTEIVETLVNLVKISEQDVKVAAIEQLGKIYPVEPNFGRVKGILSDLTKNSLDESVRPHALKSLRELEAYETQLGNRRKVEDLLIREPPVDQGMLAGG